MKPSFTNLCTKIELKDTLESKLELILIEFEHLKDIKRNLYTDNCVRLFFGFIILFCGYISLIFLFGERSNVLVFAIKYLVIVPGIIFTTGFYFMKIGLTRLFSFRKQLANAIKAKENIENVLNLYSKKYVYQINFDKEFDEIQNVEININFI